MDDRGLLGEQAAARLGVGVPRFLQLVRASPDRLGRYHEGWTDRPLWPWSRIDGLAAERDGMADSEWITSNEAAVLLGVGRARLAQLASEHPTRLGRRTGSSRNNRLLYRKSEVENFAAQRRSR